MRGCMGSHVGVYPVRAGLCVSGVCMGVHMYVCIRAVVVCAGVREQVWGGARSEGGVCS